MCPPTPSHPPTTHPAPCPPSARAGAQEFRRVVCVEASAAFATEEALQGLTRLAGRLRGCRIRTQPLGAAIINNDCVFFAEKALARCRGRRSGVSCDLLADSIWRRAQ